MKISFKRKVILHFPVFMIISLFVLVLSYYSHYVLNQKLQIIEKKDNLFNIILEARRYEKNYFLYLIKEHIEKALLYTIDAKKALFEITDKYGKYTLAKNLEETGGELLKYEKSLAALIDLHEHDGSIKVSIDTLDNFQSHHKIIEQQGRKITTDFEEMITKEQELVEEKDIKEKPAKVKIPKKLKKEESEIIDKELELKKKDIEIKKKKLELEEKEKALEEKEILEKEKVLKLKEELIEKEKELSQVELELKQKAIEQKEQKLLEEESKRIKAELKKIEPNKEKNKEIQE